MRRPRQAILGVSSVTALARVEAEKKFRRVQRWRDIKKLAQSLTAIEQQQEAKAMRVA